MKRLLGAVYILVFCSCSIQNDTGAVASLPVVVPQETTPVAVMEDFIRHRDTVVIDGRQYIGLCDSNDRFSLLDQQQDTVFASAYLSPMFSFVDFDQDGYKDILFDYHTNVPSIQSLVLYDKKTRTFRLVADFDAYPAAQLLKNKRFYYSYHRSGCADMNWDSDLFYIKDFKTYRIGTISGRECGDQEPEDGIYIYTVKDDKETLLETLPIATIKQYKEYKWGFIEQYWNIHFRSFIDP